MVFEYISGEGTDAKSRQRWARVKADTETAVLGLGFRDAYELRPGFIHPMGGIAGRRRWLRWLYGLTAPFILSFKRLSGA